MQNELATNVILQSLSDSFKQFILNFNMNEIDKTLPQLLGMLRTAETKGKRKKRTKSKGNAESKPKAKDALKSEGGTSKEGKFFHCDKPGHFKRNCPVYLEEVKKAKAINSLKECGIVSKLTPPDTPRWNGVYERRNRTLLDMVRSMMSHNDLPIGTSYVKSRCSGITKFLCPTRDPCTNTENRRKS
ncbi:hypothetical protein GQ457_08G032630 [Hibiscus cannabinus]